MIAEAAQAIPFARSERAYRLTPWLIRALVPENVIGTYRLISGDETRYVGRSDTCLRRRLLQHAAAERGDYFAYAVQIDARRAYTAECALFHAHEGLTNVIHPGSPAGTQESCPFCRVIDLTRLDAT